MSLKRILVIDDEPDLLELIRTTLRLLKGWDVMTARSGPEGLALAEREVPDAIILDVMMPGMDGFEVFRLLQAQPVTKDIPVFLLTAKVRITDQADYAQAGIKRVIAKPFDPPGLVAEIAGTLDWKA